MPHEKNFLFQLLDVNMFSYHIIASVFSLDINECAIQGICNNGQCVNAQGGFQCECKQGYALDAEGKDCLGRQ